MDYDKTTIFSLNELKEELILMTINEVVEDLELRGYNASNQLVGYIQTGDPKYITSYNNARDKISKFTPDEVMAAIINSYLGR